jgi:hypothetical protein
MHVKDYGAPLLQKIWRLAEDALAETQQVVFIGYSLPPADPFVAHLILRARARSCSKTGWKYWVFNKDACAHERFRSLLGPAEANILEKFTPQTFAAQWLHKILDSR